MPTQLQNIIPDLHSPGVATSSSGNPGQHKLYGSSCYARNDGLINCVLFNARSLNNKIDLLPLLIDEFKASLIFVTESWLKPSTPDSFLGIQHCFSTVRCDRLQAEGVESVFLYIKI